MDELENLIERIVKEGLTWSQENPNDPWYRDQIRPLVQNAFKLGLQKAFTESSNIADEHECKTYHELCNCSGAIRNAIEKCKNINEKTLDKNP